MIPDPIRVALAGRHAIQYPKNAAWAPNSVLSITVSLVTLSDYILVPELSTILLTCEYLLNTNY